MIRNENTLLGKFERRDPTVPVSYSDVVDLILRKGAGAVELESYDETSWSKILRHEDWPDEVRTWDRNRRKYSPRRVPNEPLLRRMPAS